MKIKMKICLGRGKYEGLGCGKEKHIFSHGLCVDCVNKATAICQFNSRSGNTDSKDKLKTTKYPSGKKSGVRKASGEKVLFDLIWNERDHVSEVSGKPLITDKNHFQFYWQFSHILTKGAYPKFRALKENIKLVLPDEHNEWEHHKDRIRNNPMWDWVFKKEEELKSKYYAG